MHLFCLSCRVVDDHKKQSSAKKLLLLKIQGDSYSFDIAESKYISQIVLTHSNVKEKELN